MQDGREIYIRAAATDRAEDLFRQKLGEPNNPRAREWRKGTNGSFSMEMRGTERGVWYDFEAQRGGGILDFVAVYYLGLPDAHADFGAVLDETAALLGLGDAKPTPERAAELRRQQAAKEAAKAAEQAAEARRKAEAVEAVQRAAQRLEGTPAEVYLRRRGITRMPPGWSFASPLKPHKKIKHPHRGALVAWALDDDGAVKGGQRVLVMPDGSKAPDDPRKPSFGSIGGYPARLPADAPGGPLIVAEGPETALSIWMATGAEVWATFGASNFAKAPIPTDRTVILCPDADAPDGPAGRAFAHACAYHAARGCRLYIAPSGLDAGTGGDMNDLHRRDGLDAVRAAIAAAVPFHDPAALPSAAKAREQLAEAVGAFFATVEGWHGRDWWNTAVDTVEGNPAPAHLLAAGLGLGKTTATARAMVARIRARRAAGDAGASAVMLVPMHRLGEQVAADLRRMAPELTVAVIRGAEAEDPNEPGTTACKRLEVYRERQRHLLDPCAGCPLAASCVVQAGRLAKADIYVQAHGALGAKPAPAAKWRQQHLDHVVIDESPLSALLIGVEVPRQLGLAAWKAAKLPASTLDAADLSAWRTRLAEAAEACAGGPLTRSALLAAGMTAADAKAAAGLEWRRIVKDEDSADLHHNLTVTRAVGIWQAVADLLEGNAETGGRLHVVTDTERGLVIRHRGLRRIKPAWQTAPLLMLDATADDAVAAALMQRPVARVDVIRAAEPMLVLRQDAGFTGSKALLVDSPTEKGRKACANNRRRLEAYLRRLARHHAPQRALLIGNKALLELLELPDNVVTAHFNALRGLNEFQDVAAAVIVGRPQPQEATLAAMAGAIFGREVEGRINFRGEGQRLTRHGPMIGRASVHEDPDAQRLLHLIRDAEVLQAVGRLRAVNRTAPVTVTLLSDAVLPVPVELTSIWATEVRRADPLEVMLEDGGIAFTSPAHAARAYPARWRTKQAAQYDLAELTGQKTSYGTLYDLFCPVAEVRYRLPRAREDAVALVDLAQHPDPRAALESALGCALSHFSICESAQVQQHESPALQGPEAVAPPVSLRQVHAEWLKTPDAATISAVGFAAWYEAKHGHPPFSYRGWR